MFIEARGGDFLGEDDIERLEDDFGQASSVAECLRSALSVEAQLLRVVRRYGTVDRWLVSSVSFWSRRRAWPLLGVAGTRRCPSERAYGRSGGSATTTTCLSCPRDPVRLRVGVDSRSGSRRVCACARSPWCGSPARTIGGGRCCSRACCCFGCCSKCSHAVPRTLRDVASVPAALPCVGWSIEAAGIGRVAGYGPRTTRNRNRRSTTSLDKSVTVRPVASA